MSRLWQPPAGMRITTGDYAGERRAVCDRCLWGGNSLESRERVQAEAEAHVCLAGDVGVVAAYWDALRNPVLWAPTEGL